MDKNIFLYAIHIKSTPRELWAALTGPEFSKKYFFGYRVKSNWKRGSPIAYIRPDGATDIQGKILKCDPPKVLAYTFDTPFVRVKRKGPTRVTFEIFPMLGGVKLLLTHSNLIPKDTQKKILTLRGLNNGWPAILSNLKSLLETGKGCLDLSKMNPDGSLKK